MNKQKQDGEDKSRHEQARKEVKRHLKNKNRQNNKLYKSKKRRNKKKEQQTPTKTNDKQEKTRK